MIRRIFKRNSFRGKNAFVEPDEIFLDSHNLQNFDQQQFEGRIEQPIPKKTIILLGVMFLFFTGVFGTRLFYLQVEKGEAYFSRSQNNVLEKVILFTDRGIIYDRNKVELAWNKKIAESEVPIRAYITPGFSHVLGYVSYPAKDSSGKYWQGEFIGKDGLEKIYDPLLKGENGAKIIETDARGKVYSENIVNAPVEGEDIVTAIDSRIQKQLFTLIENLSRERSFTGGAGMIMDVRNGEVLVSTSYPEYSSEILSLGQDRATLAKYFQDERKVFLDRNISGLYTPGSIVKPFFAIAALAENIIDPYKEILSTGSISIPNPYFPDQPTIFKDWRVNGWTNMMEAIAVSSDIYFYAIGGGYKDQPGLGIAKIEKYSKLFGFDQKTGIDLPDEKFGNIPSPEWKLKTFNGDPWRLGNTYHTAIGQYGFQVTPAEMVRAVGALANKGTLHTPHILLGKETASDTETLKGLFTDQEYELIHEGMRQTATMGTSTSLNVPYVEIAAKSGTAQLGVSKNKVNSWIVGFFPYQDPKYAFALMMEAGPSDNNVGASSVMRQLLDWMSIHTPEYFE